MGDTRDSEGRQGTTKGTEQRGTRGTRGGTDDTAQRETRNQEETQPENHWLRNVGLAQAENGRHRRHGIHGATGDTGDTDQGNQTNPRRLNLKVTNASSLTAEFVGVY